MLDENMEKNPMGTGLGLSICKQLIEKMGGTIKVQSKIGYGTTFIIEIVQLCKIPYQNGNMQTSMSKRTPLLNTTSGRRMSISAESGFCMSSTNNGA